MYCTSYCASDEILTKHYVTNDTYTLYGVRTMPSNILFHVCTTTHTHIVVSPELNIG